MVTARSQTRLSKPGEPEIILPGGTSCETADCAVRITPSPTVQWPATPVCPARITLLPTIRRAGQPGLRADQRVLADVRGVADLDQIVHLGSVADPRLAHRCPVDAGVGLHVHAVAQPHRPRLRNLLPVALLVLGESEAVRADDDAVFQRHVVAQNAVLPHHGVSMGKEMAARLDARIEHHVGQQRGMSAQLDAAGQSPHKRRCALLRR